MQTWFIWAVLSMIFAGATAILAKSGLQSVSADFGLSIRTTVIFLIVMSIALVNENFREFQQLTRQQLLLLIASGVTTTLSWIFYYRALKDGPVSYVAALDKGSIIITIVLSFFILKEPLTPKIVLGCLFLLAGLIILAWK